MSERVSSSRTVWAWDTTHSLRPRFLPVLEIDLQADVDRLSDGEENYRQHDRRNYRQVDSDDEWYQITEKSQQNVLYVLHISDE